MRVPILMSMPVLFCLSCKPECKNTNPIFDKYQPNSSAYENELAKQIMRVGDKNCTFWIDSYQEINKRGYLVLEVQGNNLCAKIWIDSTNTNDEHLLRIWRSKAGGYYGAGISSLECEIKRDTGYHIMYTNMGSVID